MAVYSGQGRQPFSAAQLALMEEEELRKMAAQRAFNEKMLARNKASALKNQTAMTQDDVGFFPGLLGRSSEEEQRMLAGNMYPGPQLSLFDRAKNALSDAWTNENSAYKQGLIVDRLIDEQELEQERAKAVATAVADQQAGSGQLAQQVWSPGLGAPQIQPRVVEEKEVNQGVTGIVPPGEFNFSQGKQLSDAEAGAIYSQPVAGTYMNVGEMLGRLRYNADGTFSRLPTVGTRVGDVGTDLARAAYENSRIPYMGMKNMAGDAIVGPGQWADDQIDRIEAEREYNLPENVAAREVAKKREEMKQAGLLVDQQLDAIEAEQAAAKAEEMKAAGIWATDEIVRQETEQLAAKRAAEAEAQRAAEADRIRNMQGFIEQQSEMESGYNNMQEAQAAMETVNQEGLDNEALDVPIIGEEPITLAEHILPSVEKKIEELSNDEKNDLFVDKTLRGENLLGKFLDKLGLLDNDNEGVTEEDGNATVNDIAQIAAESGSEATQETEQAGLLTEDKTADNKNANVFNAAVAGSEGASNSGIMTTTADDSMEGFTMDRLTNPLSPENKKWWMGGGGGVPGSNRAVQFFEALAYIGTPLKYRPSKTPAQQNIENQMTQMNNVMDYRSANTANPPSFASLRAGVPSTAVIENTIRGQMENEADKGLLFGLIGGDSQADIDNDIATTAYAIREKMLQMTLVNTQNGITKIPTIEEAIAAMQPPQTDDDNDDEKSEGRFLGFFK